MESGLEGRNNQGGNPPHPGKTPVSMESGLEGRNNTKAAPVADAATTVSMESGLEGRNNRAAMLSVYTPARGLNGVRPRRPEQFVIDFFRGSKRNCLNGVRPRRPEQSTIRSSWGYECIWSQWSPA